MPLTVPRARKGRLSRRRPLHSPATGHKTAALRYPSLPAAAFRARAVCCLLVSSLRLAPAGPTQASLKNAPGIFFHAAPALRPRPCGRSRSAANASAIFSRGIVASVLGFYSDNIAAVRLSTGSKILPPSGPANRSADADGQPDRTSRTADRRRQCGRRAKCAAPGRTGGRWDCKGAVGTAPLPVHVWCAGYILLCACERNPHLISDELPQADIHM